MLKPMIKIMCPICGIDLACEVRNFHITEASWAFTAKSFAHLKTATCAVPTSIICKEAA